MKKIIVVVASSVFVFATFFTALSQQQNSPVKASKAIVERMGKVVELTPQQKEQLEKIYEQSFAEQAAHRKKLQENIAKVVGQDKLNKYLTKEKQDADKKCKEMSAAAAKQ